LKKGTVPAGSADKSQEGQSLERDSLLFQQPAGRKVDFSREIRTIVANNCWSCHGPDEQHRKAGLRLDASDAARARLESGLFAIVPGKPGESELVARVDSEDESEVMPPPASKKPLTA